MSHPSARFAFWLTGQTRGSFAVLTAQTALWSEFREKSCPDIPVSTFGHEMGHGCWNVETQAVLTASNQRRQTFSTDSALFWQPVDFTALCAWIKHLLCCQEMRIVSAAKVQQPLPSFSLPTAISDLQKHSTCPVPTAQPLPFTDRQKFAP